MSEIPQEEMRKVTEKLGRDAVAGDDSVDSYFDLPIVQPYGRLYLKAMVALEGDGDSPERLMFAMNALAHTISTGWVDVVTKLTGCPYHAVLKLTQRLACNYADLRARSIECGPGLDLRIQQP